MSFFTKLNQKLVESRFKRRGLNIIQNIPVAQITGIISSYVNDGWEIGSQYENKDALVENGECAIRRGQSTLLFEYNERSQGSITGPERIMVSIASQHQLLALKSPQI